MVFAYVLIKCRLGYENQIIQEIIKIPQVVEVRGTFGEYDIFAKIEIKTQEDLEDIITKKIRRIPNITSTNSLSSIPSQCGR